ncbi:MAG: TetR/AcrR family transcriptional regulator [Verrucomicrobiae bacterium]|nr:TetR/AcrR family transcriptional regulator [Verrucomicrobiae bacterium]
MSQPSEQSRKTRILDAAERAFADLGFEGASLRQIVQAARVNLATVYYYFGSKEGLMAAVFERRFGPLRDEHWEALQKLDKEAQGYPLPMEKILETMLRPALRLATAAAPQGRTVMRLIGRIASDPDPRIQELFRGQFREVRQAYLERIHRSAPELPEADILWRFEFIWGAFAFVLCNPAKLERITGGMCNPADMNTLLAQMVACFAAGFRAPAVSRTGPASRCGKRRPNARDRV